MNISGTVISVALETQVKNKAGNLYPAWQLIFKGPDGKVSDITKHINGFKYGGGPALKAALEALQPGDNFTAVLEKKGDFNEVTQIVKGDYTAVAQAPATPASPATGRVTGSNYETPEEREWNRIRIIRQSGINYAINLLKTEKNIPSVDEVLVVAKQFAEFVNTKE